MHFYTDICLNILHLCFQYMHRMDEKVCPCHLKKKKNPVSYQSIHSHWTLMAVKNADNREGHIEMPAQIKRELTNLFWPSIDTLCNGWFMKKIASRYSVTVNGGVATAFKYLTAAWRHKSVRGGCMTTAANPTKEQLSDPGVLDPELCSEMQNKSLEQTDYINGWRQDHSEETCAVHWCRTRFKKINK